ncbi:MAG TPA: hypothetical protein VFN95_13845 [Flavitalea sp.]|nr:hypothetical protein [Flavitalea sp.]
MSEKNQLSEDYITLSGFEKSARNFLRIFFFFLYYLKTVLLKSKYIVLTGLIIGLLLGYLYYVTRPVYYKVSMVVEFNELTKRNYAEMLDQLNTLTGSTARLSKELNVSPEVAANISSFDSRNLNNDPLREDTSTRKYQSFKIILGLRNNEIADTLEQAVVNYLNNSPFLKKIKIEQKKITVEKLAFINSDLDKMDSLKTAYNNFVSRPNMATFYNNAFNPAELYEQSTLLAKERDILKRWLAMDTAAVTILDGFKATSSPQSIGLFNSMLILGSVGFLIGYLIGFMIETKKKVA